jgi:hypothetical protein
MSGVVVFLGPSLPLVEAQQVLPGAQFLGPARRGDITRAVLENKPAVVVLIDGLFNTVPAVVHKEILFALSSGVRVIGAASMGALRAAELWTYGMEGIGEIFERFRNGVWEADDEVAVTHGPAESGFRATSVALASIRLGLEQACARTLLTPGQAAAIIDELRAVFYPERSWPAVFAIARQEGMNEHEVAELKAFVAAETPDAKRDDALEALNSVRAWSESDATDKEVSPPSAFDFEPTIFWRRLLSDVHAAVPAASDQSNGGVDYPALLRDARLQKDAREQHRGAALLHLLLAQQRDNMPMPTSEQLQHAVDRFRRRRGLHTADQARKFYREQRLTDSEIEVLARAEVALDTLLAADCDKIGELLTLELKRQGQFAAALERVSVKQHHRQTRAVNSLALEDLAITLSELLDWYQDRFETIEGSLESHAQALGYQSAREFLNEVMLEYDTQREHTPAVGNTCVVAADAAAFASRTADAPASARDVTSADLPTTGAKMME